MTPSRDHTTRKIIEPDLLLAAYAAGYFPMADSRVGPIGWFSPDPRAILPLEALKVSRSLRQTLKKNLFEIRINTAFEEVMRRCAEREETWISEEIIASYVELQHLGYAHSVEAWREDKLCGGLYGVALGAAFFGESMFSRAREASKVALIWLVGQMRRKSFELLDTQYLTPHLASMGTIEIPRAEYLRLLSTAVEKKCTLTD